MRAAVRAGLEASGLTVCAEAGEARTAVIGAVEQRPDLVVGDGDLTGSGLEAAAPIVQGVPALPVVLLAGSPTEAGLLAAIRAGASGYLPRDTDPARLSAALIGAAHGEAAIPRRLVRAMTEELRRRHGPRRIDLPNGRTAVLTAREGDVLDLLCDDLGTAEIARRLYVSPATVRTHVAAVVAKLGVVDRKAAVRLVRGR